MTGNREWRYGTMVVVATLTALIAFAGCGGPDWEYYTREYSTVLPFDILSAYDLHLFENELNMQPIEYSEDGFYLIESPEHLDSVFYSIQYLYDWTPRLDTIFPEDGQLVLFDYFYPCGTQLLEYGISSSQDTLRIMIELRKDLEYFDTKCTSCWFAIGVTGQQDI